MLLQNYGKQKSRIKRTEKRRPRNNMQVLQLLYNECNTHLKKVRVAFLEWMGGRVEWNWRPDAQNYYKNRPSQPPLPWAKASAPVTALALIALALSGRSSGRLFHCSAVQSICILCFHYIECLENSFGF